MAVSFSRTTRALDADRSTGSRLLLIAGLGLVLAWAVWFVFGRVSVYEVSRRAHIEVATASRSVAVTQGGRLIANGLTVGRRVRAGEVLAQLDAEPQRLRLAEAEARLAGYPTRVAALQDALVASRSAHRSARTSATAAVAMARAQTRAAQADASFGRDNAERLTRDSLAGGSAPLEAARSTAEADKAIAIRDAAAQAEARIAGEAAGTTEGRAAAAADIAAQLASLTSEWRALQVLVEDLRREYDARSVRAPVDGVIGDVAAVRLGEVIAAGSRLATIVPGGELRILAEFDAARGLGRLFEGQPARLRLSGFAWTEYGDFPARVERVGAEPSAGLLRVELRMPLQGTRELPLRHGMEGQVDVRVEAVSPARLVLRVLGQSFA